MLFKDCIHYDGNCPCLLCSKADVSCYGCLYAPDGFAVDTEKLCDKARIYCESGRGDGK